jgi:hypothetical protein
MGCSPDAGGSALLLASTTMTSTTGGTTGGEPPPCAALLGEDHYRAAADRARLRYPGPLGELLHRELSAYARLGHLFATDGDALIPHLTTHVLALPGSPSACGCRLRARKTAPTLWPTPAGADVPTTRKEPPWSTS